MLLEPVMSRVHGELGFQRVRTDCPVALGVVIGQELAVIADASFVEQHLSVFGGVDADTLLVQDALEITEVAALLASRQHLIADVLGMVVFAIRSVIADMLAMCRGIIP